MTDNPVVIDRTIEEIAVVTLNRPEARNAVNVEMADALVTAIASCQDARCIVITGTDPAFCAGLDLRNLDVERLVDLPPFVHAVTTSEVPTIAAVNGAAVTGGFEIALGCDFIVSSEHARFADTHLRVGVYPGPVLVELPRRIGMARARELSMTGNFIDASTAHQIGLTNHVVAHDDLVPFTLGIARAIAEQDPRMVATMRRDWRETAQLPIDDAHRRHREIADEHGFSAVVRETLEINMDAVVDRAHAQVDRQGFSNDM